jgi:hypothetical protein
MKKRKTRLSAFAVRLACYTTAPKLPPRRLREMVLWFQTELNREGRERKREALDLQDVLQVQVFDEMERILADGGVDLTEVLNTVRPLPRMY